MPRLARPALVDAARPRADRRQPLPRAAAARPTGSASSAARWRRRRWSPASGTVDPEFVVHSLHSYFLLPGDTAVPIVYDVERLRDGRSFATRRVVARQHGRPIYFQTASFQREEDGLEHQDRMPDVPGPTEGLDMVDLMRRSGNEDADALAKEWAALEARYVGNSRFNLPRRPRPPVAGPDVDPGRRGTRRRPADAPSRRSPTPATSGCSAPPWPPTASTAGRRADGLARPHHLVPPPVPGRRVVALRHAVARRRRAPAGWRWRGSSRPDGRLVATAAQEGLIRPRRDA